MAVLSSGRWAVYHTRKKAFVYGIDINTRKILVTNNPGEVQYFKSKKDTEMAIISARCGKCYKAVHVTLVVDPDT